MAAEKSNDIIVNPEVIRNILTLRYNPSQHSILPKKTWQDFRNNNADLSVSFIEKSIENTIKEKIIEQNISRICIALSGGIDSTVILTILKTKFPEISVDAISIKFAESIDETNRASKIAEHFGVDHHVVYLENYLNELPKAISIIKQPFWDLHWYHVVKKAQTFSNYLLSGDGGDELFAGYTFRYKKFLSLTSTESSPLEKISSYLQCHERDRVPDQEQLFGKKSQFLWESIYEILMPYFDNPLSSLEQVFLADYNGKLLYNFSPVNTMIHNHFDITSIAPLLSDELISYAPHLPSQNKYDEKRNLGKIPLRKILHNYGVDSFIIEEKLGFNVNTLNLWKSYGQKLCDYYLSDSRIIQDGWINKQWIDKYLKKNDLDVRYVNKFLGLLAFEIWYRLFITKEMKSSALLN